MPDILHDIVRHKHTELDRLRHPKPSLRQALLDSPTGIIAEFKRRSPSKGWIHAGADASVIPLAYQHSGAAALSILTDEHYFGGTDDDIRAARRSGVTLPILYKNFVIDEAQLYAALYAGASAVLLIAACLTRERCRQLIEHAHSLGLEVLLEMHDDSEIDYATLGPDLCGINNRNLGTFVTNVDNSFRLADRLRSVCALPSPSAAALPSFAAAPSPSAAALPSPHAAVPGASAPVSPVLVSESGISDPATVAALRQAGYRGFLIGETFMKTDAPAQALRQFIQASTHR